MIDEMTELAASTHWDHGPSRLSYRESLGPFVYFIKSGSTIKIGCSDTPELRVDQIRRGVGKAVQPSAGIAKRPKLLAYGPGGYELEAKYHAQFAAQVDQGEWFHQSPVLAELIHETARSQAYLEVVWHDEHYQKAVITHGWPAQSFDIAQLAWKRYKQLRRGLPRIEAAS